MTDVPVREAAANRLKVHARRLSGERLGLVGAERPYFQRNCGGRQLGVATEKLAIEIRSSVAELPQDFEQESGRSLLPEYGPGVQ